MNSNLVNTSDLEIGDIVTIVMHSNYLLHGWIVEMDLPMLVIGLPTETDWNDWKMITGIMNSNACSDAKIYQKPFATAITRIDNIIPGIQTEILELI